MAENGYISQIQYNENGGAIGSTWYNLGAVVPSVPLSTSFALAATWVNNGDAAFQGHIDIVLTKPDGSTVTLTAASGQDVSVIVSGTNSVVFSPITLDQYGQYSILVTLTEYGETTVLDQNTFIVADTGSASGLDISALMNLIITVGIVGMMMKMMTNMTK